MENMVLNETHMTQRPRKIEKCKFLKINGGNMSSTKSYLRFPLKLLKF